MLLTQGTVPVWVVHWFARPRLCSARAFDIQGSFSRNEPVALENEWFPLRWQTHAEVQTGQKRHKKNHDKHMQQNHNWSRHMGASFLRTLSGLLLKDNRETGLIAHRHEVTKKQWRTELCSTVRHGEVCTLSCLCIATRLKPSKITSALRAMVRCKPEMARLLGLASPPPPPPAFFCWHPGPRIS